MDASDFRIFRAKNKLTQAELGKKLDVSAQTILKYENGGDIPLVVQLAMQHLIDLSHQSSTVSNDSNPIEGSPALD